MAAASLREQIHEIVDALPASELTAADRFLRFLQAAGGLTELEVCAAVPLPEEQRQAHVRALKGKYAGKLSSLEEFSRMRQGEIELEEARWTPEYKGLAT